MRETTYAQDPFSAIKDFLWHIFDCNEFFRDFIKEGNKVRFANVLGLKDNAANSDLPEIVLVPAGNTQDVLGYSDSGELHQQFRFFIATDDKRPELMNRIKWELWRCLETFNANAGQCLFNGDRFITIVRITASEEGITDSVQNRGINGWCAVWDLDVGMAIAKEKMIFDIGEYA